MQSSAGLSVGSSSDSFNPSQKRKLHVQQKESSNTSRSKPAPATAPPHSPSPAAKRMKVPTPSESARQSSEMSRSMGVTSGPTVIDLTRPSNFQPHSGAKRLVVKNFRPTPPQAVVDYYNKIWADLDLALTSIYNGQQTRSPLEILCRGVEATCRRGMAQLLFEHLKDRSRSYLEKQLLPAMQREVGTSSVDALRTVHRFWTQWNRKSTLIRSIFSYLDRSYLLNAKDLPQLEDLSIQQFRQTIFGKQKSSPRGTLGEVAVQGICDLVGYDRTGHDGFDAVLLKDSIAMLHIFGIYGKSFEPLFLKQSEEYLQTFVTEHSTSSMKAYISVCDSLLSKESTRCDRFNFDGTTKVRLLTLAHRILIEECSAILLSYEGFAKLLDNNEIQSLRALYGLLGLSKIQAKLKEPFEQYIRSVGSATVSDKEKIDSMVVQLLEMKRSLDVIIRDAFNKNEAFTYSLREAFGNFMNDRKNTTAYGTSNSKVGEMIAKYMDLLLRGGVKAVPRSLASDAIDRATAEKEGQASTGDEDAELDRQLEQALELFRFIEGKDVFEAFYKKDLARRLLMARSASQDAERNMLAKLKMECGHGFTQNLEQMFKDQELGRDEMVSYKQHLSNTSKTTMDLQVSVLSAAAWPTYPDIKVNLPAEVARHIEKYDRHYVQKHSGRKLTWKHALAHSTIRAQFSKGQKELLVSSFQAIVLVLFNDVPSGGNLSYADIANATGLIDAELQRTLQSLACAKFRILTKHPKGREVNLTDTFTVNTAFQDPKLRIKINQIQLKETKEENQETHERVHQDRQYETQAAIVRIMKSRKSITHQQLVSEVIDQTKSRGAVELPEIKKNIEKLIEKDYIEREDGLYIYLA